MNRANVVGPRRRHFSGLGFNWNMQNRFDRRIKNLNGDLEDWVVRYTCGHCTYMSEMKNGRNVNSISARILNVSGRSFLLVYLRTGGNLEEV
jgi:hypothetical protein